MTVTAAMGTVSVTTVYNPWHYIHRMGSHQRDNSMTQRPKGCQRWAVSDAQRAWPATSVIYVIPAEALRMVRLGRGTPAASGLFQGFSGAADVNA